MDVPQVQTLIQQRPFPGAQSCSEAGVGEEQAAIAASDVGVGGVGEEQARRSSRERRQVIRD